MIEGVLISAWSGFYGGTAGRILQNLQDAGVFSYVLPFLMIFALISAILIRMQLFKENRGITTIIALAVALMSLQFEFVPRFFSEVFPRLGVGLAIILVVLILIGMFMDPGNKGLMITLMFVGVAIAIVVLYNSADAMGYGTFGSFVTENIEGILTTLAFLAVFVIIIVVVNKSDRRNPSPWNPLGFTGGHHP